MADSRDLAQLAQVKSYLLPAGLTALDDATLSLLITATSGWIARYLGRNFDLGGFCAQTWTEMRSGNGQPQCKVKNGPIISVTSVVIENNSVPIVSDTTSAGIVFGRNILSLRPGAIGFNYSTFPRGYRNVILTYTGGYNTPGMQAVAALGAYPGPSASVLANQQFVQNGVTWTAQAAGTTAATTPTFPTTPTLGSSVTDNTVTWVASSTVYALVAGAGILPQPITEACIQTVLLAYKQRNRIGDTGYGVGSERLNFFAGPIHPQAKSLLDPYIDWSASLFGAEEDPGL